MPKPLTAAEAWCWVARMLSSESDALTYAWPPTDAQQAEANVLYEQSQAAHDRATRLGATNRTWKSAMRKWDTMPAKETKSCV
jgi:hypothetical protein